MAKTAKYAWSDWHKFQLDGKLLTANSGRNEMLEDSTQDREKDGHRLHSLRRKVNFFFLIFMVLILLAAVMSERNLDPGWMGKPTDDPADSKNSTTPDRDSGSRQSILLQARHGIALLTALALIGAGSIWVFLHHWLLAPLAIMSDTAERLAHGRLDEIVNRCGPDELGRIGEHINELAANFQEILLYVWNQTESSLGALKQISRPSMSDGRSVDEFAYGANVDNAVQSLKDLQSMVRSFALYDVRIENGKALAEINDDFLRNHE
jgi:methyl-accepting chemotaxis protein